MSIRPRAGAMHELALSQRIVALVLERARAERLRTVTRVAVAVGAAAGVDPEALRFCFDVVVAETMAREAELVIERVRLRARCRSCRQEFEPTTRLAPCPACQRTGTDLQSALVEARAQLQTAVAARAQAKAQATAAEAALESARVDVDFREAPCGRPPRASSGSRRNIDDSTLKSPIFGRVQVKVAEPGEVLAAGGRVFNLIDLTDVYMTFFLPTATAGLVALEAEVRTVLDAAPQFIYLVVHQPRRLNLPAQPIPSGATARNIERCLFDSALDEHYFRKVARTCYWPATERFLDLACQLPAEVHARHGRFLTAGEAIAAHGAESHHLPLPVFPASWADSVQRELEDRLLGAVAEKELEAV